MSYDGALVVGDFVDRQPSAVRAAPELGFAENAVVASDRVYGWLGKRAADVVVALLLFVLTLPLLFLVALTIRLTSRGPVFFRHRRVGRGGREFLMLKFRTMHVGAEERLLSDGALHAVFLENDHKIPSGLDPRVTRVGRVLRRLSIDELPQLLNVLAGHMSIVGPRPVVRAELAEDYRGCEWAYLALRPGLTGLWQVSGRSNVQFPERAQLDVRYVQTCGPWVDLKLVVRTPRAVLIGLGAN